MADAPAGNVAELWAKSLATFGGERALLQTTEAWRIALEHLMPDDGRPYREPSARVREAFALLDKQRLHTALLDEIFYEIDRRFEYEVKPKLLDLPDIETAIGAANALRLVCDEIDRWCQPLSVFDSSSAAAAHAVRTRLQTLFYAHVPIPFGAGLRNVYRELLRDHAGEVASSPAALAIIERLHLLALVDRYEPILLQAVYEAIEERVNSQCKGEWGGEEGQLPALFAWVESTIHRFLIAIVRQSRLLHAADRTETTQGRATTEAQAILRTVFQRFTFYLHQTLGNLRTSELFDIVVDYPESKPALDDLKVCLAQTDRRSYVAAQMIAQNARRLLHPGADTKDIIAHYVATIRCLRILDPQGVLLARVAAPVRAYLRAREDTIRNIMAALIDEGGELATELERDPLGATAPGGQMEGAAHFGGPDDDYTDVNWLPDPIDAPPDYRRNRGSDVIQLLVSIYDSKEVFVKELQVLLGQRLLAVRGYDFEREVRNVEILKKRFGEASLAVCEVMLKDLADSKRIDSLIHSPGAAAPPVHPLIVSRLFWPTFQTPAQRLLLPPRLANARKTYHQAFVRHKPDKFLHWLPLLGSVNLKLELEDRTIEVDATPVQAAVIECFSETDAWDFDELRTTLGSGGDGDDPSFVRNALFWWANQGVVRDEGGGRWRLLERADASGAVTHMIEDEAPGVESVQAQQAEQLRVYWSYIQGMVRRSSCSCSLTDQLRNLGALPVDRIHTMLGRFVSDYSGHTIDELNSFLSAMETEGLVEAQGNRVWKLVVK